jgi:hypothetical protein
MPYISLPTKVHPSSSYLSYSFWGTFRLHSSLLISSATMGIFASFKEQKQSEVVKSEANGVDYEDRNGYSSGSQDDADMVRMGKRQQTRVSI